MRSPERHRLALAITVGLLAASAGIWTAYQWRAPTQAAAFSLDDITLPDLDGRWQSLGQWKGKTVVINFWATWCPPCREEIPLFVEYQKGHGNRGLQIVGVAIDSHAAVLRYSKEVGINYPQLLAEGTGIDLMSRFGNKSGGLPFSVVVSPNGEVISQKIGAYRRGELDAIVSQIRPVKRDNP